MENKLDFLKKERVSIIKGYSGKEISSTHIEKETKRFSNIQHVIVKEVILETSDVKSFILVPDNSLNTYELAPFKAGEYISIIINNDNDYTTRAYTISSSPALKNMYRITVKKENKGHISKYLVDNLKIGDKLDISKPVGDFTYNYIRDEENVIAIAGGSGITPFMSLAHAVIDGIEPCNLTVIYSVKTEQDIIFKKEIAEINKKNKNVKFVITLTQEENVNYLHGHINKEMLDPYMKEFNTIFMCGPKGLYKSMNSILSEFNIPKKSVHYEAFNMNYTPLKEESYELKVILKNDFILTTCKSTETLLESMEKAHIKTPSLCRVGTCGFCRSILLEGKIKMVGANIKKTELDNSYIHPCVTYPESDIVIRIDV